MALQFLTQCQLTLRFCCPGFVLGLVGEAKTSYGEAVATQLAPVVKSFSVAQMMPEIIAGMPYANLEQMCVHLLPKDDFAEIANAGPGGAILILDEMPDATPMTQSACHRLFTHGEAGSLKFPERTAIIGMGNPPDQSTTGGSFAEAIATRVCQIGWTGVPAEVYDAFRLEHAAAVASNSSAEWPTPGIYELPKDWTRMIPEVARKFVAFRRAHASCRKSRAQANSTLNGMLLGRAAPAANSRTWEYAEYLVAACDAFGESATRTRYLLLAGLIGEAAAMQFLTYEKNLDLPDPEDCLSGMPRLPREGHMLMAVCQSVVAAVLSNNTCKRFEQAWDFLGRVADETGMLDMPATACTPLVQNFPKGWKVPMKDMTTLHRLVPTLQESGLLDRLAASKRGA